MPGRQKSARLKQLEGDAGKRGKKRRRALEAHTLAGAPRMPVGLPLPAQREWRRITVLLHERGGLSELDRAGLADYCVCKTRLEEAEKDIGKRGTLVPGARGRVKNPSIQIARQYRTAFQRWVDLFGLAPLSRERLAVRATDDKDDLLD